MGPPRDALAAAAGDPARALGLAPDRQLGCSRGWTPPKPITARSVQRACCQAVETAGLDKSVTVHTLRHSFATHLLEQGVDIRVIQHLLGHRQIASTTRYARVALHTIRQVKSPLELLDLGGPPPA